MALTYVGTGTVSYSTGSPQAGVVANAVGDLLILAVGTKPDTTPATTPSGWTLIGAASGGTGTTGIDTGPMRVGLFMKIATSANEVIPAVTVTGNNVSAAQAFAYRVSAGNSFDVAGTGAADTTTGTPFSAVMPLNPGMTVNDQLLAVGVIPTDVGAAAQFSAETVSATGMTTVSMTEINEWSTSTGQDMGGFVARGAVVTGTATAAPTVSATAGGTTTNVAGPIYLVRIREVVTATLSTTDTGTISATESASVTPIAPPVSLSFVASTDGSLNNVATTWTTPSFAMPANGLAVITLSITGSASDTGTRDTSVVSSTFSGMGAWSMVQGSNSGVTAKTGTYTFWSLAGASPGTGTITVNITGAVADFEVSAHVMTNVDQTTPVIGAVGGMADAVSTLPLTLGATPTSSDLVFQGITSRNFSGSPTSIAAGQTVDYTLLGASPNATQSIIEGRTTTTSVGASGLNTVHNSGTAIIVKAAPLTSPPNNVSTSDSGTISATENATLAISNAVVVSDSGTLSATDVSANALTTSRSDSGTLSATDASSNSSTLSRTDTGALSGNDVSSVLITIATSDSGTLSATDVSGVNVTLPLSDAGTLSASDASTNAISVSTTDAGSLSGADSSANSSTVSLSDSGNISAADISTVTVTLSTSDAGSISGADSSANSGTLGRTDSGTLSATEASSLFKAIDVNDAGTFSATDTSGMSLTIAANDSGSLSASESLTQIIDFAKSTTESGTISGAETSFVSSTGTASDTGTISATDVSLVTKSISLSDSGTISGAENAVVFNNRPTNDTGIISATDASSLVITGTISKSASEAGTISAIETSSVKVFISTSDTGALSVNDSLAESSTSSRADSGTVSATEDASLFTARPLTDGGVVSAIESSSVEIFEGFNVLVWDGADWIVGGLSVWNGVSWSTPIVRRWNGITWV